MGSSIPLSAPTPPQDVSQMPVEDLAKAVSGGTPKQAAQMDMDVSQMPIDTLTAAVSTPLKGGVQQTNIFQPLGDMMQYFGGKWQEGEASVIRGGNGDDIMRGTKSYEQVQNDVSLESLKQLQQKTGSYESQVSPWDPRRWVGDAVSSLPFMRDTIVGGVKGGLIGGAIGGAAGLAGGPLAEVTVPGGAAAGSSWGYKTGEFTTAAKISGGQLYMDLRDAGISHHTAKGIALAGGATMGLLQTLNLEALGWRGRQLVSAQMKTSAGKAMIRKMLLSYAKSVGIQIGLAEANTGTELIAKTVAGHIDKNPKVIPSMDDVLKQLKETAIKSAGSGLVLTGVTHLAHMAAEPVKDKVQEVVTGKVTKYKQPVKLALTHAMQVVKEGMDSMPPSGEEVQKAKEQSDTHILEQLQQSSQPLEDKPLVGRIAETVQQVVAEANKEIPPPSSETPKELLPATAEALAQQGKELSLEDLKYIQQRVSRIVFNFGGVKFYELTPGREYLDQLWEKLFSAKGLGRKDGESNKDYGERITRHYEQKWGLELGTIPLHFSTSLGGKDTSGEAHLHITSEGKLEAKRGISVKKQAGIPSSLPFLEVLRHELEHIRDALLEQYIPGKFYTHKENTKRQDIEVEDYKNRVAPGVTVGDTHHKYYLNFDAEYLHQQLAKYSPESLKDPPIEPIPEGGTTQDMIWKLEAAERMLAKGAVPWRFMDSVRRDITDLKQKIQEAQERTAKLENIEKQSSEGQMAQLLDKEGEVIKQADLSNLNPEVKTAVEAFIQMIDDPAAREEALAKHAELLKQDAEALEKQVKEDKAGVAAPSEVPDTEAIQAHVAKELEHYEEKTPAEKVQILKEVQQTIDSNHSAIVEKVKAEKTVRQERIDAAIASVQGKRPLETLQPENSEQRLNTAMQKAYRFIRTVGSSWINGWNSTLHILSQDDPQHKLMEIMDIHKEEEAERNNTTATERLFQQHLEQTLGEKEYHKALNGIVKGSLRKKVGEYVNAVGKTVNLYMSRNEMMKLYLQMHDPDLRAGLEKGNMYTWPDQVEGGVSTYELLDKELTPTEKKVVQGVASFYADPESFKRLADAYREETGVELQHNPFYSGFAQREGYSVDPQVRLAQELNSRGTIRPKSVIERVANAHSLAPADIFSDASRYIAASEHFIAWHERERELRAIITNKDFRNAVKLKYGEGMLSTLNDRFNASVGTKLHQNEDALKLLKTIRRNAATAFLGLRPHLFVKHVLMTVHYLHYVSGQDFVAGLIDFSLHPKKAIETLEKSGAIKDQIKHVKDDLLHQFSSGKITKLHTRPTFKEASLWMLQGGVKLSTWAGGWAVYKAKLKETGSPEQALEAVERATKEIQYGGTAGTKSQLEDSGYFGQLVTLFLKPGMLQVERQLRDTRDAVNHPSVANIKKLARTIAIHHAAAGLAAATSVAVPLVFGNRKEQKKAERRLGRETLMGASAETPMFGEMIRAMTIISQNSVSKPQDRDRIIDPEFLPGKAMSNTYTMAKAIAKEVHDGHVDAGTAFDILHAYANSAALAAPAALGGDGLPLGQTVDFLDWALTGGHEARKKREKAREEDLK